MGLFLSLVIAAVPSSAQPISPRTTPLANPGQTITVRLSSFAFDPEQVRLQANRPVRLLLVNESSGRHNFTAPSFFAASSIATGSLAPNNGEVEVAAHGTVEIDLVPQRPGTYPLECTHFLHALFGMKGTIEVTP
jgi:uncharacterized cupredoxin-like copper-binding protein